jgi:hypothetical protein
MKKNLQFGIVAVSLVPCGYFVAKMLESPTMILPSWFILCLSGGLAVVVATGIGYVLKRLLGSGWHTVTFASIILAVSALVYLTVTYRPTCEVVIDPSYAGEVKLFVSRDANGPEIPVSRYGVGYISKANFDNGFYPRIRKGDSDISKEVGEYRKSAMATTAADKYSFEYLAFDIPGNGGSPGSSVDSLLKAGAIDTTRLLEKP